MQQIPLSQDRFAIVDDDDYERLSTSKWFYRPAYDGKPATAMRNIRKADGTTTTEYLSRVILQPPADMRVVFLNGDGLDCRRGNLAVVDRAHAQRRSLVRRDSLSGIKGVRFNRGSGTWSATLCRRGRRIALGTFPSAEEATAAYQWAADQWELEHGQPLASQPIPLPRTSSPGRTAPTANQSSQRTFSPPIGWRNLNIPVGGHRGSRSHRAKAHPTNTDRSLR